MPSPPPVDLRAVAEELSNLDARFAAWAREVPGVVLDLFGEASAHVEVLPAGRPGSVLIPDVVVLAGSADTPDDERRVLHVEWQTRRDPTMHNRMLRYGLDLALTHEAPVRSLVVQATGTRPAARPSARLVSTATGAEPVMLVAFDTMTLRTTLWTDLIDPARPTLAALVPTALEGETRLALRVSLRTLTGHLSGDTTAYLLGLALHLHLAELRSIPFTEWIMAARAEEIEFPDGLDWTEPGVVRDVVLLHQQEIEQGMREGWQKGRQEGRQEGRREGRQEGVELGRRALLDVAANVASDAELDELGTIHALDELSAAVRALLTR